MNWLYFALFAVALLTGICAFFLLSDPAEPPETYTKRNDPYEGVNDR